jgi:hypothetical protein
MFREKLCALLAIILALPGGGWAEFQVNNHTDHHQSHPAVATNATGEFVVVWRSHAADGRGGGVYARCFHADGTAVGEEFKVNISEVDVDNWTPAVAMGPSGDFVVAWAAVRDADCDVVARMFDGQGLAMTDEFTVNAPSPGLAQSMPSIAMNSTGDFVVAWTNRSGGCYVGQGYVAGRAYRPDGTPRGEEFLVNERLHGNWPDVGMDDAGRFVVAWIRMGDPYKRPREYIMFRRYEADGTPAGEVVCITDDLNSRWYGPSVAVDRSGEFAIAWAIGPFPYDILAQHFSAEGIPITAPYMVNACMEGNQGHPRIATNGEGEYLVVWDSQEQDGSCHGVFGQRCARSGALVGGECPLNTFTPGRQWYPDVAMAADGTYVVTWISEGQDGSGYGVFAETGPR